MTLLAGAEHRGPTHPQSSRAAASKGARLPCTRRSLRSLLAPAGPSRLSHVLQTLHVRPEPEPQCPPLNALGITGPAPGRLDSVILTGTASPSLGAPCWSPHGSWDPKALPRTLRADPGQWLVCSGPRGSTLAEGPSFGGPAGLPTALVQPDPSATPRVTVRPQPLDLLGPHKATSPGNPIPLGALLWRLPGPPRASQGTAQPKPWFARSPPDPGPRVCLRWGGGVPAQSPSADPLSTCWVPGLQPMAAQAELGRATRNPGRQTCGQGCPGRGGRGRTTSHQRPVASTGRNPEVRWHGPPAGHSGETRRRGRKGDGHTAETQGQRPGGWSCPHPCQGLGTGVGPAQSAPGRPGSWPGGDGSPRHLAGGPLRSTLPRERPGCCARRGDLERALAEGCPPRTPEHPRVPEKVQQPPCLPRKLGAQGGVPLCSPDRRAKLLLERGQLNGQSAKEVAGAGRRLQQARGAGVQAGETCTAVPGSSPLRSQAGFPGGPWPEAPASPGL